MTASADISVHHVCADEYDDALKRLTGAAGQNGCPRRRDT